GHRSGGFNPSYPVAIPSEAFYDSETNWTYELGAKSEWLDGRLLLTAAVFHIDWEDMQLSGASADPAFPSSIIRNSGGATSNGFEVEARYAPGYGVSMGIGYAFSDPEFDSGVIDR